VQRPKHGRQKRKTERRRDESSKGKDYPFATSGEEKKHSKKTRALASEIQVLGKECIIRECYLQPYIQDRGKIGLDKHRR